MAAHQHETAASGLTREDLKRALDFVGRVQSAPDLDGYRREAVRISELVPANVVAYNEVNSGTGATYAVIDPPEAAFDGVEEVFARCAHEHPVIRHHQETGHPGPHAVSDFLSAREVHELELYREVWGPMGVEDQISIILPAPPETVVGLAINRAARGFSNRDRELLELVRPHLGRTFEALQVRATTDRALGLLQEAMRAGTRVLLTVGPDGRIIAATDAALQWISGQLGQPALVGDPLPPPLDRWHEDFRRHGPQEAASHRIEVERGRLRVGFRPGGEIADTCLVLVELNPDPLAREQLAALGLSEREAEVMRLVVEGHPTAAVAQRLSISPHTAEKHMTNIHRKLGVHSRSAAIARVLGIP